MKLRSAALLAFAGMLLLLVFLLAGFFADLMAVARGLLPAVRLVTSLVYVLASLSVTFFFYVFYKAQA